jgi:hypothetical protein
MTLQASPLHTVSLRYASRTSTPVVHAAQIEQHSLRRIVKRIFGVALSIATVLLVGCSDSLSSSNSKPGSGWIGGGGWTGSPQSPSTAPQESSAPIEEPSSPPQAPSAPIQIPGVPIQAPSAPIQEPSPPPEAPSDPIQEEPVAPIEEPSVPPPEPSPPPEEPSVPPPEPSPPPPEAPVVQCGSGMAARDLSGQCRASPPTMGALEAIDGTNVAMASVVSLTVARSASQLVQVSWQPFGNHTAGYMIYYGTSANTVNVLVSDLSLNSGLISPSSPSVTFDSVRNLGLYAGDTVCFRIDAYNSARTVVDQASLGCRAI